MEKNILDSLVGKRVFITVRSQSSFTSSSIITTLTGYDARFVHLTSKRNVKSNIVSVHPKEIIMNNYIQLDDIDNISDIDDEDCYNLVVQTLQEQHKKQQEAPQPS